MRLCLFPPISAIAFVLSSCQSGGSEQRTLESVALEDTSFRDVSFENTKQDLELAGMLFIPEGEGPFPSAVMIHGSGTSSRRNGWYLTLAEHLQDNGIAVLLPDKRGSERSEGNWRTSSFEDLAGDTLAGIEFMQGQRLFSASGTGVIGLSQGGHIAPLVAERSQAIDFLVNVVGSAQPMHETLIYEEVHNINELGLPLFLSRLLAYPGAWSLIHVRQREFWDAIGNFDPLPYWERVSVPSLILYGENDTNVDSGKSARLLWSLDNPDIQVNIYADSGHGLESPVGEGNSVFREDARSDIATFIHQTTNSGENRP